MKTPNSRGKSPQRILVTGGAGFIGSHTVDLLLRKDKEVVVLDNLFSGKLDNLNLNHPNMEFIEGDVLEYPYLEEFIKNCDAILHLAAIASVQSTIEDPIYSFQVNVQSFLHVLEAARKVNHKLRIVYASSAAVYGETNNGLAKDDVPLSSTPLSPYALHKIENEKFADLYARLFNINSLGMRYFNVYGSRQDKTSSYSGVISRFIEAYKEDKELIVYGDGEQSRDFIEVSDVASANLLALESDYTGAVNIATGRPQTLLKLIQTIEEIGKKPAQIRFEPQRPGDIKSSHGTTQLAEQHLGFRYAIDLKDGIAKLQK